MVIGGGNTITQRRRLRRSTYLSVLAAPIFGLASINGPAGHAAPAVGAARLEPGLVSYSPSPRPVEQLTRFEPSVKRLAETAAGIADASKDDFMGSYVDDQGRVFLVTSSDVGKTIAEKAALVDPGLGMVSGPMSSNQALAVGEELQRQLNSAGTSLFAWGAEPSTLGLWTETTGDVTPEAKDVIAKYANVIGVPLEVDIRPGRASFSGRQTDLSPYAGGARVVRASSASNPTPLTVCSSGFGFHIGSDDYLLTAGHCYARDFTYKYSWVYYGYPPDWFAAEYQGQSYNSTFKNGAGTVQMGLDNAYHGDLALVKMASGKSSGSQIFWGPKETTNKIPVTSSTTPTVGNPVCINGAFSGSDCGLVINKVNFEIDLDGVTVKNVDRAHSDHDYDCAVDGDSGGSVVVNHSGVETQAEATGIISGVKQSLTGGCDQIFTGREEAVQAWGGGLNLQ